jgi:hypothetical protein
MVRVPKIAAFSFFVDGLTKVGATLLLLMDRHFGF